jgi:hypothetical protein
VTQTFQIPYRPSSDTRHCPSGEQWYNPRNGQCYTGLAVPITFDFSHQNINTQKISTPGQVVVGIAFNTTSAGPHPLGNKPCRSTAPGCPYDSLNVSTDGDVYTSAGSSSSLIDPNGVFFNYISTANACNTSTAPGVLEDDTMPTNGEPAAEFCWTGFHPELQITAHCGDAGNAACPSVVGGQSVPTPSGDD